MTTLVSNNSCTSYLIDVASEVLIFVVLFCFVFFLRIIIWFGGSNYHKYVSFSAAEKLPTPTRNIR